MASKAKTIDNLPDGQNSQVDEIKVDDQLSKKYQTIDTKRALKLRLVNKLSYGEIAKQLGCYKSSVHKSLQPFLKLINNPDQVQAYQENKAALLTSAEMILLNEIVDQDKLKSASLNNAAYAFGQISQQGHLARGEATSNVNYHVLSQSVEEMDRDLARLESELGEN